MSLASPFPWTWWFSPGLRHIHENSNSLPSIAFHPLSIYCSTNDSKVVIDCIAQWRGPGETALLASSAPSHCTWIGYSSCVALRFSVVWFLYMSSVSSPSTFSLSLILALSLPSLIFSCYFACSWVFRQIKILLSPHINNPFFCCRAFAHTIS